MSDPNDPHSDALRDDVRTVRTPPVAGPNYRNLGLAAGALLVLVAVALWVTPMKPKSPATEAPAAASIDKTYLDEPPRASEDETTLEARRPWWKRFSGAATQDEEPPIPPAYSAWPADSPADPVPAAPDPKQQAFERALKSSRLRKPDAAAVVLPGRTPQSAVTDPMLAAAASVLPSPDQVAKMLAATSSSPPAADDLLAHPVAASAGGPTALAGLSTFRHAAPLAVARATSTTDRVLRAGTLIPVRLETAIDSDAPGPVTARVLRDVTDSATGREVLIPAGALLLGSVANQLAYGQDRALVAFERLLVPGASYELPGFEALESTGTRGLADQVNRHVFPNLGRAVLLAALGAGFELAQPDRGATERLRPGELVAARMGLELDRVAAEILSRGMNRPPTVRIRAGERFAVYLNRDLGL